VRCLPHAFRELVPEDDHLRVRVVEYVVELVVEVAVVDVRVDEPRLEGRADSDQVLGAVAQVEGDPVAGPGSPGHERRGQIVREPRELAPRDVREPRELAPRDAPVCVAERGCIRRQHRLDAVQDVSEVPRHA
jgi:hypothetical protein